MIEKIKKNFEKNGFVKIKNFLHPVLIESHYNYFLDLLKEKKNYVEGREFPDVQVEDSKYIRNDIVYDTLLSKMTPVLSTIVNKKLVPTYAYCRYYEKGQKLKKHVDRESCEYSMTINLGNICDDLWPICFKDRKENTVKIKMKPGEGVIYKGMELKHWRKKFEGEHQIQLFLHYVDSEGPYKNFIFDGRPGLHSLDYDINYSLTFYPNF